MGDGVVYGQNSVVVGSFRVGDLAGRLVGLGPVRGVGGVYV